MFPAEMLLALRGEGIGVLMFTEPPQVPVLSSTLHTRSLTTLRTVVDIGAVPPNALAIVSPVL